MRRFTVSASPHVREGDSTRGIMLDVILALTPAAIFGIVAFGPRALTLYVVSIVSAVVAEYCTQRIMKRPVVIGDLSAVVTGMLLAMNLPSTAPWWIAVVGSAFAIVVVKQLFGGLGSNFVNPALTARAVLVSCWVVRMTTTAFVSPTFWSGIDAVSGPTPLALIKSGALDQLPSFWAAFTGNISGTIGETSALTLLVGGIYLIGRRVIDWRIPVAFLGTVFAMTFFVNGADFYMAAYALVAGGVMLAAFFMATDYVTSPITPLGRIIMGVGCGVMVVIIRKWGGYPEGATFAVLLMNIATPLIDRFTKPKVFGGVKRRA